MVGQSGKVVDGRGGTVRWGRGRTVREGRGRTVRTPSGGYTHGEGVYTHMGRVYTSVGRRRLDELNEQRARGCRALRAKTQGGNRGRVFLPALDSDRSAWQQAARTALSKPC